MEQEIEDKLAKNLPIILKYYQVQSHQRNQVACWLLAPSDKPNLQDIYLNEKGEKLLKDTVQWISTRNHPTGKSIGKIHPPNFIESVVIENLQDPNPDYTTAASELAATTLVNWTFAIAVDNVEVRGQATVGSATIYPPGLSGATWIPTKG